MVDNQSVTKRETNAIINSDMDKREFKITIGIRSYWITSEEMQRYMIERTKEGTDYVVLRDGLLILPVKFQEIVHRSVIEASEKIEDGRWQCDQGNWHHIGGECRCNYELVDAGEGTLRLQEKTIPALEEPKREEQRSYPPQRSIGMALKSF